MFPNKKNQKKTRKKPEKNRKEIKRICGISVLFTYHLNQSAETVNLLVRQGTQTSETKHAGVVGVSIKRVEERHG